MSIPLPHQAGQVVAWPGPVETSVGPLAMVLTISLHRLPRARCLGCGNRRVLFRVGLGDDLAGPALCARCAGIR
jgi:hypothetical protein